MRCSLLMLRGDLLREAGRSSDSLAAFRSALDLGQDDSQRCQAWMGIAAAHRVTADLPPALDALDRAQAFADRLAVPEQLSRIHHVRGNLLFASGDSVGCEREHAAAFHHAQEAANAECEAQALSGLGDAKYLQGRMLSGLDFFSRCVALCERTGLTKVQLPNRCMVGHCLYYANRMDEAVATIRSTLDDARRLGQAQTEIFALESLGLLLVERQPRRCRTGLDRRHSAGAQRGRATLSRGHAVRPCRSQAGARVGRRGALALEEALALSQQSGMAFVGALTLSLMARAQSTPERARHFLVQAGRCAATTQPVAQRASLVSDRHRCQPALAQLDDADRYAAMLERYVRPDHCPGQHL